MRRLSLAALVALSAACSLPVRDNPIDPLNAPVAELHVVDRGFPVDGACESFDADDQFSEVVSASRGHCLALDARQSDSPRDNELVFTFAITDTAGNVLATPVESTQTAQVALIEGFLRDLPFGEPLVAHLSVEDVDLDITVTASATFELENAAPVLVVDRPRTLPLGGFSWEGEADFSVPFGIAGSTDPDGDPLYVRLTFPGEAPVDLGPVDPALTVTTHDVPSSVHGPFAVKVELFDGPDAKPRMPARAQIAVVRVGEPNPWAHLLRGEGAAARLDGTNLVYPIVMTDGSKPALQLGGVTRRTSQDPMIVVHGKNGFISAATWPQGVENQPPISIPGTGTDADAVIIVGADGDFWRVGNEGNELERYSVDGAGVITRLATAADSQLGQGGPDRELRGTVAENGDLWAIAHEDDGYIVATPAGATIDVNRVEMMGRSVFGIARRPESGEVWILDDSEQGGDPRLHQLTAPGAVAHSWDIASDAASAIAFAGNDSLWLAHGTLGLVRVDLQLLDVSPATPLEAAILDEFPVFGVTGIVADADTKAAWAHSNLLDLSWRADIGGRLDVLGAAEGFFDVDPAGAALFARVPSPSNGRLARGSTTATGARDRVLEFGVTMMGAADATTGGAWLYRTAGDIVHVDEQGSLTTRRSQVLLAGSSTAIDLPALSSFRPSVDGTHAWAIEDVANLEPARVFFFDLREDPMPGRVVLVNARDIAPALPSPDAVLVGSEDFPILEPSAPSGNDAWIVRFHNGTPSSTKAMILSTDGNMVELPLGASDIPEIGAGVPTLRAANVARTNSLCLAAWSNGTSEIHFRRLNRDGTVDTFLTTQTLTTDSIAGVASSSAGTTDYCWVAWSDLVPADHAVEIRAFADADATPERTATLSVLNTDVEAAALVPYRDETVWTISFVETSDGSQRMKVHRHDFPNGAGAAETADLGVLREGFAGPPDRAAFLSCEAPLHRYFQP